MFNKIKVRIINKLSKNLPEVQCALKGHDWGLIRSITKNSAPGKIPDRTVCKRCGKIYHTHDYINN